MEAVTSSTTKDLEAVQNELKLTRDVSSRLQEELEMLGKEHQLHCEHETALEMEVARLVAYEEELTRKNVLPVYLLRNDSAPR